jgi:glycosyltransferase involved in cell wall biosynthesis
VSTLAVEYFAADHLGYGRMGLQVHAALERAGVTVTTDSLDGTSDTQLSIKIPPLCKRWLDGQRRIIWTMYETTECPAEFRDLHEFEQVIVPCQANFEAFSKWHPNVVVVPLAVDDRWQYRQPMLTDRFTFLASGSEYRKGLDVAAEAFIAAFPGRDDVELVMKTPTTRLHGLPSDPRFRFVDGFLSAEDEVALYASANCYVGMSRGEGFGMMPLQAIVQGTPTLLSSGHGHGEFERFGIPVETTLQPADHYRLYGEAGDWWEPSVDDCVDKMRDVVDNYSNHVHRAKRNAVEAGRLFTWDNTVDRLLDVIGEAGPYTGSGQIREVDPLMVTVRVTQPVRADIGAYKIDYQPGVEYWCHPDVKRVLRDAGYVDDATWHDFRMRRAKDVS